MYSPPPLTVTINTVVVFFIFVGIVKIIVLRIIKILTNDSIYLSNFVK